MEVRYDEGFLRSLEVDAPSLEGYLYPDTYKFSKGTKPETIFKRMVQRMKENFNRPLRKRSEELGFSENEVLTLASIIEREARHDIERPIISAVFHNRLKKNMRLQADPTVLYGVKNRWKRIRYSDLKRETPYNTYRFKGLPPGPIASPGIKSIRAALYPSDDAYLYFVAKNNGWHYFSESNAEHSKAVVQYQLNGVKKIKKNRKSNN
ncbi:MAG: endolytic transglycosylase MltG [Candidatus Brocadiales bacterium]|nr:endolytic transglycosylase MltG [Candidatus Brocadiales bacterium]